MQRKPENEINAPMQTMFSSIKTYPLVVVCVNKTNRKETNEVRDIPFTTHCSAEIAEPESNCRTDEK